MFYLKDYRFLYIFISVILCADNNTTLPSQKNYIDNAHTVLSNKIVDISENIDTGLKNFLESSDKNASSPKKVKRTQEVAFYEKSLDAFYNNKKFAQETEETYVSIKLDSYFQSKEKAQYHANINAQLPLVRSQKYFHLFINNLNQEVTNTFLQNEPQDTATIGVNYFTPIYDTLKSKYTLATHGLNPFVQAQYFFIFDLASWKIEPIQTFTYAKNEKFSEESNLYFDKNIDPLSLFRFTLGRKTQEKVEGIDYITSLQYFYSPKKKTGINLTQSFLGNTEYKYLDKNQNIKKDGGVTNYVTTVTWRENIYREWLFYQITPGVSFNKKYDYAPNYTLLFLFDLYFGKLNY